jgi:tetratricopeptide (TPR) repeat protein
LLQKRLSLEDWGHARRWLGFLYYKESDFCAAIEIAKELLVANLDANQMGQAHYLMGECLLGKSHDAQQVTLSKQYLAEAVEHFEQAAGLIGVEEDERAEVLLAWGTALRFQNQFDKAIKILNAALKLSPTESIVAGMCHEQLGLAYFGETQYKKVIFYLEEAVRILLDNDPDYLLTWVYATLSRAYVWLQQYNKALANAQCALEAARRSEEDRESQLADAHQVCGDVYYYSELDLSLAQKHYKEYLKLLGNEKLTERAQILISLANIERMRGKHKRALKGFKKVLALNAPGIDNGTLYLVIGECAAKSRNFKEAVRAYKSAIEHSGDDKDIIAKGYLGLGHNLFRLKRYEEATITYREGLKYVDSKAPERVEMLKYMAAANDLSRH